MEAQLYNVTYQWATPRFRKGGGGVYFLGAEIFGQNYQPTYLQQYQRINWFSQAENKWKSVLELEMEPYLWLSFDSNVF